MYTLQLPQDGAPEHPLYGPVVLVAHYATTNFGFGLYTLGHDK